ncbi:hypothetical protein Q427_21300 [Halomonas sp. BC04]|nr:hypothetical protein Q427_21300 [Halomonas sp. BC04]
MQLIVDDPIVEYRSCVAAITSGTTAQHLSRDQEVLMGSERGIGPDLGKFETAGTAAAGAEEIIPVGDDQRLAEKPMHLQCI